jgi:hypothetical protein
VTELDTETDPIDLLIPRPRSWWVRLVIGVVVVGFVGVGSFLWGTGAFYPRPDCCGSGGGGAQISLTEDGTAVTITTMFFNASRYDLWIQSATAVLPGATVVDVAVVDEGNHTFPISLSRPLPTLVRQGGLESLVITFRPNTCVDSTAQWGTVTAQLDVADSPFPTISRTYRLPNAVVDRGQGSLSVFAPESRQAAGAITTPLAAACALLGRS